MTDEERNEGSTAGSSKAIPRRRFLDSSWKVLGVALVAEGVWTSYDLLRPTDASGTSGIVDAGVVGEFMNEGTVKYSLNGGFYVTQYQGGLRALYQKCPHLGCKVPWDEKTGEFKCPCHGSVYNVIGEYESGPAPRGLDRFPVSIENGHVMVDTSAVIEGPPPGIHMGPPPGMGGMGSGGMNPGGTSSDGTSSGSSETPGMGGMAP